VNFDDAFDALIGNEGGYSNDPEDPGGETMWGVTARVARAHGYAGAMKDLPRDSAKEIAHGAYWVPAHCDEIPDALRFDIFDAAYNEGVHEAIVMLQRVAGVKDDGIFGPATAAAVAALDGEKARRWFNADRLVFYTDLAGWEHDGKGWARRVAQNLRR
jgi:lysozyme family protein